MNIHHGVTETRSSERLLSESLRKLRTRESPYLGVSVVGLLSRGSQLKELGMIEGVKIPDGNPMNIHHGVTETRSSERLLSESVTEQIIGAAIEVHRQLGPGLLESVYEECMCQELRLRGIPFRCQVEHPVTYKGIQTGGKYRIDLIVADEVLVELKSVERILGVHEAQLLTYLKLTGKRVGLLINFNVVVLHRGILRRVL